MNQNLQIQKFVTKVRSLLSDLAPSVVADLTDGLEADLQDRAAEEGAGFKLGKASEYAVDLRASAGFSTIYPGQPMVKRAVRYIWATVKQVFGALAPAWWVARGLFLGQLLSWMYSGEFALSAIYHAGFYMVVASVLLSILVGVKLPKNLWTRSGMAIVNVALLVVAVIWLNGAYYKVIEYRDMKALEVSNVLVWDGHFVGPVEAYDKAGKLVPFETLKSGYGWTIYKQSEAYPPTGGKGGALNYGVLVGMTQQAAKDWLAAHGNPSVSFMSASSGQPTGTVIGFQEMTTSNGHRLIIVLSDGTF